MTEPERSEQERLDALPKLNLGCGRLILEDFVNVDVVELAGVDVVCDLDSAPWPWPDDSVGYIIASHVFEHVEHPVLFMTEAHRVLASGGAIDIRCPWYLHRNAYTDPTHRRYCTEETWDYWCEGTSLFAQYGSGMGSGPAGARFKKLMVRANPIVGGTELAEVQAVLGKLA